MPSATAAWAERNHPMNHLEERTFVTYANAVKAYDDFGKMPQEANHGNVTCGIS